jgi:circadian clock protein KaiC
MITKSMDRKKLSTGIEGLDSILCGGLPAERIYLIEGNPGSGKTTLAMQFLMEGARKGEKGLYITLSESKDELMSVSKSHGWDLTGIEIYELINNEQLNTGNQNTFFYTSELELNETNQSIIDTFNRVQPDRLVFDSLSELKLLAQDPIKFRRQILAFKQFFLKQKTTALLLDDKTNEIGTQDLHSIVHGVLSLEQLAPEYGAERRRIRITKLRGLYYRGGFHDFRLKKGGMSLFPRLMAVDAIRDENVKTLSSGIAELDALLGRGIECGSSTLIMGPAGAGKSTIALQYAYHAAKNGKKSAFFTFDEGRASIITRCRGLGLDVEPFLNNGLIQLEQIDPAELSPGEFMCLVRESVDIGGAAMVAIDSLNGYLNAMPEERFLLIQMHELLSHLNLRGAVTFLVVAQHGLLGMAMDSAIDVSYLADNVLLLRYYENAGSVHQAVSVVKKRRGYHERTIRELRLSSEGIKVGEPLTKFHGVLTGTPQSANINRSES